MMNSLHTALRSAAKNKFRTAITALSVFIGVLSVLLISGIVQAGKTALGQELSSLGADGLTLKYSEDSTIYQLDESALQKVAQTKGVKGASPIVVEPGQLTGPSGSVQKVYTWGVGNNADSLISLDLLWGRSISRGDIASRAAVCLLDSKTAQEMFGRENVVGKRVPLNIAGYQQEFEVVGVVSSSSNILKSFAGGLMPTLVYTPYTVIPMATGDSSFDQIAVKLDQGADSQVVRTRLQKAVDPDGRCGVDILDLASQKDSLDRILDIVTLVLSCVAAISLLVAGMCITTVMISSVAERTREIGIKKAIGATSGSILREFLAEAMLLSLVGSTAAALLCLLLLKAATALTGIDMALSSTVLFFSLAGSVLLGGAFGAYPAYKAARMHPVEALRRE